MKRLKVLLSAYACEPHRGSEPGIGWNTATELSKHHRVWVLTSSYHRPHIERELKANPRENLNFIYVDVLERLRPLIGEDGPLLQLHYYLWQIIAYGVALRTHQRVGFDIAHHVSYVRCWTPSFISLLPVPFVWGPLAGNERSPLSFVRSYGVRGALFETVRKGIIGLGKYDPFVRLTAKRSALAFASSEKTATYLRSVGASKVTLLSATVTPEDALQRDQTAPLDNQEITFISIGRLLHWKGFHLAIKALAESGLTDVSYQIVGGGEQEQQLKALAKRYGVDHQVSFHEVSREEMFQLLENADILFHPAVHDAGPTVILEAMSAGKPFICLDMQSPEVSPETGVIVPIDTLEKTVTALAGAMKQLANDSDLRRRLGETGRRRVETELNWVARGQYYSKLYQRLVDFPLEHAKSAEIG